MKASKFIFKVILPLIILGVGVFLWISFKELPQIKKEKSKTNVNISNKQAPSEGKKQEDLLIVGHHLVPQSYQVYVNSRGVAQAGEEIELSVETEGRVTEISREFEVGAIVKKDSILLKIDDADLQDSLIVAQARVAQAEASLAQEQVRAEQALVNWNELGYEEQPSDLVLRKPQLRQAEASLAAAISQVELAKRALTRIALTAPFDGIIAERQISVGERASRGRSVGRLISTDYSTLSLPVSPVEEQFLADSIHGSKVTFSNALMREGSPEWQGFIVNREPEVDATSKQLHLIARVMNPYSLSSDTSLTLPVGQPVTAKITGRTLEDVYIVPKSALRGPEKIHIMTAEHILAPLQISPIVTDTENIVFRAELTEEAYWVESVIPTRKEGEKVILDQSSSKKDEKDKL